jgi:molybdopterin-guanine dinucleotide biosynthesis protein A
MSLEAAQHHHNAAEHLTHAAYHHKQAQRLHEAGRHEQAAHHACLAQAHQHYASVYATEANKAYMNDYGHSRAAVAVG